MTTVTRRISCIHSVPAVLWRRRTGSGTNADEQVVAGIGRHERRGGHRPDRAAHLGQLVQAVIQPAPRAAVRDEQPGRLGDGDRAGRAWRSARATSAIGLPTGISSQRSPTPPTKAIVSLPAPTPARVWKSWPATPLAIAQTGLDGVRRLGRAHDGIGELAVVVYRPVGEEGVARDGQDVATVAVDDADEIGEVAVEGAREILDARPPRVRDPLDVGREARDVGEQERRAERGRLELRDRPAGRQALGEQPRHVARKVVRRRRVGPSSIWASRSTGRFRPPSTARRYSPRVVVASARATGRLSAGAFPQERKAGLCVIRRLEVERHVAAADALEVERGDADEGRRGPPPPPSARRSCPAGHVKPLTMKPKIGAPNSAPTKAPTMPPQKRSG